MGKRDQQGVRWPSGTLEIVKRAGAREGTDYSGFVRSAVIELLKERHPDLYNEYLKIVEGK